MVRQKSFSRKVKDDIFQVKPYNLCCYRAELAAIIHLRGYINVSDGKKILSIRTDNSSAARYYFKLIKELLTINALILYQKTNKVSGYSFLVQVSDQAAVKKIFEYLGADKSEGWFISPKFNPGLIKNDCCRRSYLRGAFIAGGSVNDPKYDYHLEILSEHEVYAQALIELMDVYGINGSIRLRKKGSYVYLKSFDAIIDFLKVIRAYNVIFRMEDARIMKSKKNEANRMLNCDMANVGKTIDAAKKQIDSIKTIQAQMGLDKLSPSLEMAAKARLYNKEMSLKDLGETMEPPVSKSGMSYRMKALIRIANKLSR